MIDVELFPIGDGLYDFELENGDFKLTKGLGTQILISLLGQSRATQSEVILPELRGGFAGNELNATDFEDGSKIWLLYNARRTEDSANRATDYAQNALQWLLDDNLANDVEVESQLSAMGITINIAITGNNTEVENFSFNLWDQTFVNTLT